jgi:apolipoprotein N-acyltransferase
MKEDTLIQYVFLPEVYIGESNFEEIKTSIHQTKHIVIGGAELMQNRNKYNIFFVKKDKEMYIHKKERLVPVIEYVPIWLSFDKISEFKVKDYDDDLRIDTILPFSVLICYESIFNQIVKKSNDNKSTIFVLASEYFLNHSTIAYNQYNNILRVRAVEYGKQIIKVSFQGDNVIINAKGDIIKKFDNELITIDIGI